MQKKSEFTCITTGNCVGQAGYMPIFGYKGSVSAKYCLLTHPSYDHTASLDRREHLSQLL